MIIWIVGYLFISQSHCEDGEFSRKCEYKGDMCAIDVEYCTNQWRDRWILAEGCPLERVTYGSGPLYKNRLEERFWINIAEKDREQFPAEFTYSIVRKANSGIASETLPGCCNLTLRDFCTLPVTKEDETLFARLPVANDQYLYCDYELQEKYGTINYCVNDNQTGCTEFNNGVLTRRKKMSPTSSETYATTFRADYCLFAFPKSLFNETKSDLLILDGISWTGKGGNFSVNVKDYGAVSPTVVPDLKGANLYNLTKHYLETSEKNISCFISRLSGSTAWESRARCINTVIKNSPSTSRPKLIIAVTVPLCVSAALLLTAIGFYCFYRHYFKKITFKKTVEELPEAIVAQKRTDAEGHKINVIEYTSPSKEVFDEITFSPGIQTVVPTADVNCKEKFAAATYTTSEKITVDGCSENHDEGFSFLEDSYADEEKDQTSSVLSSLEAAPPIAGIKLGIINDSIVPGNYVTKI